MSSCTRARRRQVRVVRHHVSTWVRAAWERLDDYAGLVRLMVSFVAGYLTALALEVGGSDTQALVAEAFVHVDTVAERFVVLLYTRATP